jgi:uncharacterized protein involved in exopolysaccharide biosynthesis
MSNATPDPATARRFSPLGGFVRVFMVVFMIVFGGSALITFLLPVSYMSSARARAASPGQIAVFQSEPVLGAVADELDLRSEFARRYGETEPLDQEKTIQILRRSLRVRPVRGADLVEIRVFSHDPDEAARLANAVARKGAASSAFKTPRKSGENGVVELAIPSRKPARPNKALNLALGALVGLLLGAFAGGVGARLAVGPEPRPQS